MLTKIQFQTRIKGETKTITVTRPGKEQYDIQIGKSRNINWCNVNQH